MYNTISIKSFYRPKMTTQFSLRGFISLKVQHNSHKATLSPRNYSTVSIKGLYRPESPQGHMMTSSNGNIFLVTGPLRRESIGHRWIPLTQASEAELCFLQSEQTDDQTIETPVISDAIAFIMTSWECQAAVYHYRRLTKVGSTHISVWGLFDPLSHRNENVITLAKCSLLATLEGINQMTISNTDSDKNLIKMATFILRV